jgi:hypothetical protein
MPISFKLAGGKAGLKMPNAQNPSFPNHRSKYGCGIIHKWLVSLSVVEDSCGAINNGFFRARK